MTDDKNENVIELKVTPEATGTKRVVSLPVFSTKVLAGLETDETMAKVKSVQRKKRRKWYRKSPLKE